MKKTLVKLLTSRAINKIGNIFYDYGNSVWLASMGALGQQFLAYYQMADTLTSILFNPISGALVDRFKRRKVLLWTDAICALVCFLAAFVTKDSWMLYILVIANVILAISSSFSRIANKSFLTEIVAKEDIITYNSHLEVVLQVIGVSSPIFSFIVVHFTSLRVTLLLDALTFLVSFLLIYAIKPEEIPYQTSGKAGLTIASLLHDMLEGLQFVWREKAVLFLLVMAALVNFLFAGFAYLLPFSNQLFGHDSAYATMLSLGAVGSISAALVSSRIKSSMTNLLFHLLLSGLGVAFIGVALFVPTYAWVFYAGNFATEFFMTIFNIHFLSQIQMRVPNDLMGRVFSVVFMVAIALMPCGTWLMAHLSQAIDLVSFIWLGLGVVLLSLSAMIFVHLKHLDQTDE